MAKLFILQGLPASGKSTFAKQKAKEEKNTIIINRDKIREMLKGVYSEFPFGSNMENLVTKIEDHALQSALLQGYNVISDNTNFRFNKGKASHIVRTLAPVVDVEFEFIMFNTDVKECLERDSKREFPVGKKVITDMYFKYMHDEGYGR